MSPVEATVVGTWDEVEEKVGGGDFQTLPPGTYEFYLAEFEKRVGQDSGNEYIHLDICHEKDEDDVEEGQQRRFHIWPNLHFTSKTLGMTKRALRIMGCDLSRLAGVAVEAGVVPDEVLDMLEDVKADEGVFKCKVRRRKSKDQDGTPRTDNEVMRWVGDGD